MRGGRREGWDTVMGGEGGGMGGGEVGVGGGGVGCCKGGGKKEGEEGRGGREKEGREHLINR